jgi:hypothetical protein
MQQIIHFKGQEIVVRGAFDFLPKGFAQIVHFYIYYYKAYRIWQREPES